MSVRWALGSIALAACFSPTPPTGVPCVSDTDCPSEQLCHPITRTCETSCDGCTPDGPPPTDGPGLTCWDVWLSGNVQLAPPRPLDQLLGSAGGVSNPSISDDGLTLYFDRNQDFFRATRGVIDDDFDSPTLITELRTDENESRISITGNGKVAVFASSRIGTIGLLDLWQATRQMGSNFGTPSSVLFGAINDPDNQFDPEMTPDGLDLYWAPSILGQQRIHHASRPGVDDPFSQVSTLEIPVEEQLTDLYDPSVSPDQRVLVFAGQVGDGTGDLYFTTRAAADQPFGTAVEIPGINTDSHEGDSELSSDGCTLYFVSTRQNGAKIFTADLMR